MTVALRGGGGVYYVPPGERGGTWELINKGGVIRAASAHKIFKVSALSRQDALEAILDAVECEAAKEADAMVAELSKVDNLVSERLGNSRLRQCDEVEQKISRYWN